MSASRNGPVSAPAAAATAASAALPQRPAQAPKQAIDRIVETAIYLQAESRRLAREKCAQHGITATQLSVLKLLQNVGELSLSELSRHLAARNSTITGIIDRMATADLVTREQSAEDRRVWKIRLTARGRALAESIDVAPWDLLRAALAALPESELGGLISTLERIAAHVERAACAAEGDASP